jgi:hypothetical protein
MKTKISTLLLALALVAAAGLVQPSSAPAQASPDDPALVAIVTDVITQQTTLLENQSKMDTQIAAVAEDVRQARLFAARGGR